MWLLTLHDSWLIKLAKLSLNPLCCKYTNNYSKYVHWSLACHSFCPSPIICNTKEIPKLSSCVPRIPCTHTSLICLAAWSVWVHISTTLNPLSAKADLLQGTNDVYIMTKNTNCNLTFTWNFTGVRVDHDKVF